MSSSRAMPFQYKPRSKADYWLNLLDGTVDHDDTYTYVLSTLAAAIRAASTRIEAAEQKAAEQKAPPEHAEFVCDHETEVIRELARYGLRAVSNADHRGDAGCRGDEGIPAAEVRP
jgi:hypothetical protein